MPLFINFVFYSKRMKVLTRAIGLAFYNSRAKEISLSVIIEIVCHLKKNLNSVVGLLNSQLDIIFGPSGIGSNMIGICPKINFIIKFNGFCGSFMAFSMIL